MQSTRVNIARPVNHLAKRPQSKKTDSPKVKLKRREESIPLKCDSGLFLLWSSCLSCGPSVQPLLCVLQYFLSFASEKPTFLPFPYFSVSGYFPTMHIFSLMIWLSHSSSESVAGCLTFIANLMSNSKDKAFSSSLSPFGGQLALQLACPEDFLLNSIKLSLNFLSLLLNRFINQT